MSFFKLHFGLYFPVCGLYEDDMFEEFLHRALVFIQQPVHITPIAESSSDPVEDVGLFAGSQAKCLLCVEQCSIVCF